MAEGPHARSVCSFAGFAGAVAAGGVFAQVMNDGSGSGKGLRMSVEAEAGEFGHPELFAKNAFAVVALEGPVFEAGLDAAGAFEERGFRGFEQLRGTREQGFARAQKLEFVAQSFLRARPGKFRGLKFAGGEIHEREAQR